MLPLLALRNCLTYPSRLCLVGCRRGRRRAIALLSMLYLLNDMSNEATSVPIAVLPHFLSSYLNCLRIVPLLMNFLDVPRSAGSWLLWLPSWRTGHQAAIGRVDGLTMHEWERGSLNKRNGLNIFEAFTKTARIFLFSFRRVWRCVWIPGLQSYC